MKHMKTATLIASACAGLIAAAPASAQKIASAAVEQRAPRLEQRAKAEPSRVKYCVTLEAATGSRITQRQCRTKRDWEALGLDTSSFK